MGQIIRVLDFETTGTEPPAGQVIEVGYCDVVETAPGQWMVWAPISRLHGVSGISVETRAVHHIPPAAVAGLEEFDAQDFVLRSEDEEVDAIAAHRAEFEGKWLGKDCADMDVPLICTWKAALRAWPEAPAHNNQVLRYWLEEQGLTLPDPTVAQPAHRAGPDAYVTAHTVRAMLMKGITLEDMIGWTAEPAALPTIPIGKQKGAKWSEVEEGFLRWMLTKSEMDRDLVWNARRELDRRAGR